MYPSGAFSSQRPHIQGSLVTGIASPGNSTATIGGPDSRYQGNEFGTLSIGAYSSLPPNFIPGNHISGNQNPGLPLNQVVGISENQFTGIPGNKVPGISGNQGQCIPGTQFSEIPPNHIANIPGNQFVAVPGNQLVGISPPGVPMNQGVRIPGNQISTITGQGNLAFGIQTNHASSLLPSEIVHVPSQGFKFVESNDGYRDFPRPPLNPQHQYRPETPQYSSQAGHRFQSPHPQNAFPQTSYPSQTYTNAPYSVPNQIVPPRSKSNDYSESIFQSQSSFGPGLSGGPPLATSPSYNSPFQSNYQLGGYTQQPMQRPLQTSQHASSYPTGQPALKYSYEHDAYNMPPIPAPSLNVSAIPLQVHGGLNQTVPNNNYSSSTISNIPQQVSTPISQNLSAMSNHPNIDPNHQIPSPIGTYGAPLPQPTHHGHQVYNSPLQGQLPPTDFQSKLFPSQDYGQQFQSFQGYQKYQRPPPPLNQGRTNHGHHQHFGIRRQRSQFGNFSVPPPK